MFSLPYFLAVDHDGNACDEFLPGLRLFPTFPHLFHLLFVKYLDSNFPSF